jgi:hypothetical protein
VASYAENMTYTAGEARQELLDTIAEATDELAAALASLGAAYEQLDEQSADRLEEQLFRPVQLAYGRARRTHAGFASRHGLPGRTFEPGTAGAPSHGVRGFLDLALAAVERADGGLAELQDSMRPVEVGDAELRAGLAEVRELLSPLPERARELLRRWGR